MRSSWRFALRRRAPDPHPDLVEVVEEIGGILIHPTGVRVGMHASDLRRLLGLELAAGLAEQRIDEQAATHADATMDAPHRELDADALQGFAPREHMLVHAVHERAVEIEEESGAGWHESGNVIVVNEVGAQHAAPLRFLVTPSRDVSTRCLFYFSSISCGRACPVGKCSKSTSNFGSSVIPAGPRFTSRTR